MSKLDDAVDAVNVLFDTMLAGKGDSGDLVAYSRERSTILRSYGFTERTFRAGCRTKLDQFAQANTHGVIAVRPPEGYKEQS